MPLIFFQIMAFDSPLRQISAVFFLFIFMPLSCSSFSMSDSESLIKLKKSLSNSTSLSSWLPGSDPCAKKAKWRGVVCINGVVIGVRLERMGLSGKIDVDALANIQKIRSLSFAYNSFSDSIPDFHRLSNLKAIYLTGNQFSGEIKSSYFGKMVKLKKIWLSENKFSGEIPSSLMSLYNLIELRLENNEFTGNIPSIKHTKLRLFNVSNNNLRGEIPPALAKFDLSCFGGNSELCGDVIHKKCKVTPNFSKTTRTQSQNQRGKDNVNSRGAAIVALATMVLAVIGAVILTMRKKEKKLDASFVRSRGEGVEDQVLMPESSRSRKSDSSLKGFRQSRDSVDDLVMVNDEKGFFRMADLMKADAEVLGNGGSGSSFKAQLSSGVVVVVKKMKDMNALGKVDFGSEMRKLGNTSHPNVLGPLAYHFRVEEKLVIYEYIPKGSLFHILHGDSKKLHYELDWHARLQIVQGIARGLSYLHIELASLSLPHGNLKSSNVFINANNEPLVSEFGFNPFFHVSTAKQALLGYKAPEAAHLVISPKCDVYCLGVIIFELLTGRYPSVFLDNGTEGIDLVHWVENARSQATEYELFDPDVAVSSKIVEQMKVLLCIGVDCCNKIPGQRIELREAMERIDMLKRESDITQSKIMHELPSLRDGCPPASHVGWTRRVESNENIRKGRVSSGVTEFSFASPNSNFET